MVIFLCDKCSKKNEYKEPDSLIDYLHDKYTIALETPSSFKSTVDNLCSPCLKDFVKDFRAAKETASRLSKEPYKDLLKRYNNG